MKAIIFDKPGLENLRVTDYPIPSINNDQVLIKVKSVGLNPIDYFTCSGFYGLNTNTPILSKPLPHIPGVEIAGIVHKKGSNVRYLKKNDRVVIYNRLFDSSCDLCISQKEMICRNGGLVGVVTNGGLAEYIAVPQKNVFKIPKDVNWNLASSLSVCGLTAFHAINMARLLADETLLIFGASGSTGIFSVQLGKLCNAKVIAVTKKNWIMDFGADNIISEYKNIPKQVSKITNDKMADVVINPLGKKTWNNAINSLDYNGRLVAFGVLTGNIINIDLQKIYLKQLQILGSNGGTVDEFKKLIKMSKLLKVKTWKEFALDETGIALHRLFDKTRNGRIIIKVDK